MADQLFAARVAERFGSLLGPSTSAWRVGGGGECYRTGGGDGTSIEDEEDVLIGGVGVEEDEEEEEEARVSGMIGLDCTLDKEEEEDAFDRVAMGGGGVEELAGLERSMEVLEENVWEKKCRRRSVLKCASLVTPEVMPKSMDQERAQSKSKQSKKRVRFAPEVFEQQKRRGRLASQFQTTWHGKSKGIGAYGDQGKGKERAGIPDHIRNPQNYTRYTFDEPAIIGFQDSSCDERCPTEAVFIRASSRQEATPVANIVLEEPNASVDGQLALEMRRGDFDDGDAKMEEEGQEEKPEWRPQNRAAANAAAAKRAARRAKKRNHLS